MTEYFPLGRSEEMSEGEYQAMCDWMPDLEIETVPSALLQPAGVWRTRDGRMLRIAEMSREHLENAIRLFSRWNDHDKIRELREELGRR